MNWLITALRNWFVLLALWFLFVYQFSWIELLIGSASVTATVLALSVSLQAAPVRASLRPSWLLASRHLAVGTMQGLQLLLTALYRHLRAQPSESVWQGVAFHCEGDEAEQGGRRALAVLLVTITPNSYVVGIDRETDSMLIHSLKNTPVTPVIRELERSGVRVS